MKGYSRQNQLLSLCGLNCGLCQMKLAGYCPGCGGGAGHQPCAVIRCALAHGGHEYCYLCEEYPCDRHADAMEFDSFITHRNMLADLEKAKTIGIESYNGEQREKVEILRELLENFNDGRRKTFYCAAVNLLDLESIRLAIAQITASISAETTPKERAAVAVRLLQRQADNRGISLKLRKKR
ncbi:MAG: DUF3795 domain-containing protein [Christensenellaceae bacterium]|nr:DUF3795 domain-containing protein [Christensenellaceae bacterium]